MSNFLNFKFWPSYLCSLLHKSPCKDMNLFPLSYRLNLNTGTSGNIYIYLCHEMNNLKNRKGLSFCVCVVVEAIYKQFWLVKTFLLTKISIFTIHGKDIISQNNWFHFGQCTYWSEDVCASYPRCWDWFPPNFLY